MATTSQYVTDKWKIKLNCHKCGHLILKGEEIWYHEEGKSPVFHEKCFNNYEHYYGLDKPID